MKQQLMHTDMLQYYADDAGIIPYHQGNYSWKGLDRNMSSGLGSKLARGYAGGGIEATTDSPRAISLRERLEQQKTFHEDQIAKVTAALDLLDKNPSHEQLIDLLGQISY